MASHGTFAAALNCMDGRCQEKAFAYAKQLFGTDYVDMITEPGMDGILAGTHSVLSSEQLPIAAEWVRRKAEISAKGHGSSQVVIFGHCQCAGNAVRLEEHRNHLQKAKETVEGWGLFERVHIAVFNEEFEIEEVP